MRSAPKSSWKGVFYSSLFLFTILGVLGFMTLAFARAYYQRYQIEQEIKTLKNNKQQLETKKFKTAELLKYVQSDDFVEQKARTELRLKKFGEQVVVITTATTSQARQPMDNVIKKEEQLSNPTKWWRYFFKHH